MNMAGYTKLFNSILASTIWRSDDKTRIVWITLLAMADKDGICEGSIPGLADLARVSIEDCESALAELMAPDKYSRTTEFDGRRIEPVDGGWLLLNHSKYRAKMSEDDIREKNRQRQAKWRANHKSNADSNAESQDVTDSNAESRQSRHTEAEANTKAEHKEEKSGFDKPPPRKKNLVANDTDWLESLKKEGIYAHVDFDTEVRKAQRWLEDNAPTRKFTKKYFTNWINRIEKPLNFTATAKPKFSDEEIKIREALAASQEMARPAIYQNGN